MLTFVKHCSIDVMSYVIEEVKHCLIDVMAYVIEEVKHCSIDVMAYVIEEVNHDVNFGDRLMYIAMSYDSLNCSPLPMRLFFLLHTRPFRLTGCPWLLPKSLSTPR
jgi:hypothetical protein